MMSVNMVIISKRLKHLREQYENAGQFCLFTDITNLPNIVHSGQLLSRNGVLAQKQLRCDCASREVLEHTPSWVHDYVRLYFAPLTPMLYRVEGIKRRKDDYPECPRPFYLVFREDILTIDGCRVSDGNMGSNYSLCEQISSDWFLNLPFSGIYHRGMIPVAYCTEAQTGYDIAKLEIKRQRHAEVLIPTKLSLDFLKAIVYRSEAEMKLAMTVGNFPEHCKIEIRRDWFNVSERLYLDTITDRFFLTQNEIQGDHFVIAENVKGQVRARMNRCICHGEWGHWETINMADLPLDINPKNGWIYFYLNNYFVYRKQIDYRIEGKT